MQVFLDTDIGDDIDDVLALAMILESPELDLLGVSTVHGEVEIRSRLAAKLLATYGRGDVPVHTGFGQPYNKVPRTGWAARQGQAVADDEQFPNIHEGDVADAVRVLLTAAAATGPVKLIAIGPLTNIARILERHPEVAQSIDQLYMMGGDLQADRPEYNIQMDPEAAQIVFDAGLAVRVVPFNQTHCCLMREELMALLRAGNTAEHRLLDRLIGLWSSIDGRTTPVLHDPLAIGALLRPEIYRFEAMRVSVELQDAELRGATRCTPDPLSRTQVCTGVDYEAFHELMLERIGSQCRT